MAEQAASAVAAAVIGGVTDRALTTLMRKLRSGSDPAAAHEKLQRLELLLLKLRCAIEVSEKHAIVSASLLDWRDRLRATAAEAGAVVLDFQRRAIQENNGGGDGEAAATSSGVPGQQQQQQEQPAGALFFTRSALFGMAKRVRDVTRRLFSADEDAKKLDGALEKMERCSRDITEFLLAVQLEVLPELSKRRRLRAAAAAKRSAPPATTPAERFQRKKEAEKAGCLFQRSRPLLPSPCSAETDQSSGHHWVAQLHSISEHGSTTKAAVILPEMAAVLTTSSAAEEDPEREEARMLASVLEPPLLCAERHYVKGAEGRDMGGLVWLLAWAALLREAVERGNAMLQTLRTDGGGGGLDLEEDGELYSFVRVMPRLAYGEAFWWVYALRLSKQYKQ